MFEDYEDQISKIQSTIVELYTLSKVHYDHAESEEMSMSEEEYTKEMQAAMITQNMANTMQGVMSNLDDVYMLLDPEEN